MINESNFKCSKTGKLFTISDWKAKIENGKIRYYERRTGWYPLTNPENGELLEKIEPVIINMTSVHTETTVSK